MKRNSYHYTWSWAHLVTNDRKHIWNWLEPNRILLTRVTDELRVSDLLSDVSGCKNRNNVISIHCFAVSWLSSSLLVRSSFRGYKMVVHQSPSKNINRYPVFWSIPHILWSMVKLWSQPWTEVALAWLFTLAHSGHRGGTPPGCMDTGVEHHQAAWTENGGLGFWFPNLISELML